VTAVLSFWVALIFMAMHEIDAIKRHEWRILPMTSFLPETIGRKLFIWVHLPLAALAVWLIVLGPQSQPGIWFSGFAVIHVVLHWLFRKHPKNEFANLQSWLYVAGSGMAGLLHLVIVL
jgi:hypothetical protein